MYTKIEWSKLIDVLKNNEKQKFLITGTGMTCAYSKAMGSYPSFYEDLLKDDKFKYLDEYFLNKDGDKDKNFENAIKHIEKLKEYTRFIGNNQEIDAISLRNNDTPISREQYTIAKLEEDLKKIRYFLIKTIIKNHDRKDEYGNIKDERLNDDIKLQSFANFLNYFDKIGTFNYDLLKYWATVKYLPNKFFDGFSRSEDQNIVSWNKDNEQNVFYFHGNMLFFVAKNNEIVKIKNDGIDTVATIALKMLGKDFSPLFIAEGKYKHKNDIIKRNDYLKACKKSLNKFDGIFVIYGASLDEVDNHIYNEIFKNKKATFYINLHGVDEAKEKRLNALAIKHKIGMKNIFVFDTSLSDVDVFTNMVNSLEENMSKSSTIADNTTIEKELADINAKKKKRKSNTCYNDDCKNRECDKHRN